MQSAYLPYCASQIHYSYRGSGNRLLCCLHGYGETEKSFHFLADHLPPGYCLVALDLPYHGKTEWKEGPDLDPAGLHRIIQQICDLVSPNAGQAELFGYSMGGRLALQLFQAFPETYGRLVLAAPDGLKLNFWYWLATQTKTGNRFFLYTMNNPDWFIKLVSATHSLGLIHRSFAKFTLAFIHDKNNRELLYKRWTCMRRFRPNIAELRKQIAEYSTPIHLLYGRHDRIIRHERGTRLSKGLETRVRITLFDCGHALLQEKNHDALARLLLS